MRGHGQKLTRKQESVISALLSEPTHADAARKANISEATLSRWLARDDFQAAYKAAKRRIVDDAVGRLSALSTAAVDALQRNLCCGKPAAEIRSAVAILGHVLDKEEKEQVTLIWHPPKGTKGNVQFL